MKKVLILGVTGMLGSMVYDYLSKSNKLDVRGTARDVKKYIAGRKGKIYTFDAGNDDLESVVFKKWKPDYVINCIGIIKPYCKDDDIAGVARAIKINADFPHRLSDLAERYGIRVIQIATDCVWSGTKGKYDEKSPHDALDVYGKTKSLGEIRKPNFLNIRASIVGPELHNKVSLLEWFLARKPEEKLTGFTHHYWNGVTTLQFAHVCRKICESRDTNFDKLVAVSNTHHLILNETVNKHQLLVIFNKVFKKGYQISAVDNIGQPVDRTLSSSYNLLNKSKLLPMEKAVLQLKRYMDKMS